MLTNIKRNFLRLLATQIVLTWSCSGSVNRKSDDLDLLALKTIVEQQAARIATLESDFTALKNGLPRSFQQGGSPNVR